MSRILHPTCMAVFALLAVAELWAQEDPCQLASNCPTQGSQSTQGEWSDLMCLKINYNPDGPLPTPGGINSSNIQAIHAALLKSGKVVIVDLMTNEFNQRPTSSSSIPSRAAAATSAGQAPTTYCFALGT
ncbi:hypothetical protein RAS1_39400 [Phycisphaerae bacterium RAS1]|nr:hypothetical protein RAS1_39400 [Phycisphaerae bacterium RAS1]